MHKVTHIRTGTSVELPEFFTVTERDTPLVLSVPHSGQYVLTRYADRFKFGPGFYVDVDWYTDLVYPVAHGSSIIAHLAPQQVNMNRSWQKWEDLGELDPIDMKSLIAGEKILLRPYSDAERRELRSISDAYHTALSRLIHEKRQEYGYALLIDCHSMSSRALANVPDAGSSEERSDFVIGSLDDTSADPRVIEIFDRALREEATPRGLRVVRNNPYSGGYITQRYHDPANHVHALQLEMKKKTYMHEGIDGEAEAFERRDTLPDIAALLQRAFERTRDEVHMLLK